MHYNLSEEQKTFLHISYSMLEEGYDVDQIMEFWNLNDESKVLEICESITLSETIDTGNPDFLLICEKGGMSGFLMRLFGRGGKVRLRKPPTTTKGGRPITSGATRPGAKVDPTKPPSLIRKLKDKIPSAQKTKIKQGAAVAGAAGLVTLGTKVALDNKLIPGISDPSTDSKVDTSDPEEKVETPEEKRSREQREAEKAAADAKAAEAAKAAKAKSSSSNNKSAGWWRLQNQPKDLYKNSPGYQVSLKAYKNIRANPVPSIYAHYEVIADYLIKEGHASDIKEADYVMNQLDEEFIQSIIESSCGSHKKKKKKK
jgi:hypothetical protein